MKFYAVRIGRVPGVYTTWEACAEQVRGFPGAQFKAFQTESEASAFVKAAVGDRVIEKKDTLETASPRSRGVEIWVDGACLQHGPGGMKFGWAFVIVKGRKEVHRASGNDVPRAAHVHRNVAGEVYAVLQALKWCNKRGIRNATVHFDYEGLASWVDGSWQARTPWTQHYRDAVRTSGMTLKWKKVPAHSGVHYNEIVDQLAREAAQRDHQKEG